MASIARQASQKLALPTLTSARCLSTSAAALAAKGAKGSAPSKKAQQGFSKKPAKAGGAGGTSGGSGGSGGGSKRSITLKYENAQAAPDLSDLQMLQPETLRPSNVGAAAVVPPEAMEKLRVFGLSRRLDKEFVRGSAVTVIRDTSVDLAKRIDGVKAGASQEGRTVVLGKSSLNIGHWIRDWNPQNVQLTRAAGEQGTGKSTVLLHSITHALNSGWIVLYVPKASEWISSSSPYIYNPTTQQFSQPALASSILDKLIKVNGDALAKISVQSAEGAKNVLELAQRGVGVDAGEGSVVVLREVLGELGKQSEVPVMIAIDEVQALFSKSEYLTPTGGAVESYHLSTPRLFLDYLMGRETLKSGLILSALSNSTPSLPTSLTLASALSLPSSQPITPYTPLHADHFAHASALIEQGTAQGQGHGEVLQVKGYTPKEAAGVFGLLSRLGKNGAGAKGDEAYLSAFTIAAGNPLKFTRSIAQSLHA